MNKRNAILIIDGQVDFCDPKGALFVQGAEEDTQRTVKLIEDNADHIDYISLTQDSHQSLHIAHPVWWKGKDGSNPPPFTLISSQDIKDGIWTPQLYVRESISYIEELEKNGEYKHCIWPKHCIIGSSGAAIVPELMNAVLNWQEKTMSLYEIVQKGEFPLSEHFGALRANVPYPGQESTEFNHGLYAKLNKYSKVFLMGQAKSHCVGNTLKQMLNYCPDLLPKLNVVTDAMSDVAGFEGMADSIFAEAESKGVVLCTTATAQFLK